MRPPCPTPPAHPGVRFPPPLLFVLGFVGGLLLHRAVPLGLVPGGPTPLTAFVAWVLVAVGLVLGAWALVTFWTARTAVFPHRPAARIVETGPYRWSRNPMYVALGLVYVGPALWLDRL